MQKRKNISLKEKKITSLKNKSTQKRLGYLDDSLLGNKVLMTNTFSFLWAPVYNFFFFFSFGELDLHDYNNTSCTPAAVSRNNFSTKHKSTGKKSSK